MTQQALFNRVYILDIGPPNQTAAVQYSNYSTGNGAPTALRVGFEIDKNNIGSSANHSKITIYNLSTESRQKIVKGWSVQLQAGYQGLFATIFIGSVFNAKSERKGADIVTTLECLDGGAAIGYSKLHKSYGKGTALYQILQDVANAMSLTTTQNPSGLDAGVVVGLPDFKIGYSFTAVGPCKDTLDKLLRPFNLTWSVQNNCLTIVPQAAYTGQAIVISPTTGLIDVPSFNNDLLSFKCLLNPQVVPNGIIKLSSENATLNGYYKIKQAKYEGDTHESKWNITCEAFRVPGTEQTYPSSAGFNYSGAVVS